MMLDPAKSAIGGLPGAGGNPWLGLTYIVSLIAGAGLVRFMFYSVRKNERGAWFRLGNVVRCWTSDTPKVLLPGRPGVRFPFVWQLVKVSISVRTNRTEDIEMVRVDPNYPVGQKWVIRCDINWRVQTGGFRVVRAALRADDLEATVMAIVTNAVAAAVRSAPVGTLESDIDISAAVVRLCKPQLGGLGVGLNGIKLIKYAPADAQILANAIDPATPRRTLGKDPCALLSASDGVAKADSGVPSFGIPDARLPVGATPSRNGSAVA